LDNDKHHIMPLIDVNQCLRFGGSLADTVRSTNLLIYLLTYLCWCCCSCQRS